MALNSRHLGPESTIEKGMWAAAGGLAPRRGAAVEHVKPHLIISAGIPLMLLGKGPTRVV